MLPRGATLAAVVAIVLVLSPSLARPSEEARWMLGSPAPLRLDLPAAVVSSGAEPIVLTDRSGQFVWIGDTAGIHRTANNGSTWSRLANPVPSTAFIFYDGISLAQDQAGSLYATVTSGPNIQFARSDNGGSTWAIRNAQVDVGVVSDRPWIAARHDKSGEAAIIYFAFPGREACLRTTDGGLTWIDRTPFEGRPQVGGAAFDDRGWFYFVSSDGVLWRLKSGCLGGNVGDIIQTGQLQMFPGGIGATGMLQVATDGTNVYSAAPTGNNDGFVVTGVPGDTMTTAARKSITITDAAFKSVTYTAISAHGDELAVAFYASDVAGDPSANSFTGSFHTYVARVNGFWTASPTVTITKLTGSPNHHGWICMSGVGCPVVGDSHRGLLDYMGVDHDIWGGVHVAYVDDSSGTFNAVTKHARLPP